METENVFENQPKIRKAELIVPPNILKQKIGSGGIDPKLLVKAQEVLETNTTDFRPIATGLLENMDAAIEFARNNPAAEIEPSIERMIYPAMQLKAQGSMFHFPLITEISDILVNFLETVSGIDKDVLEIVTAHKLAIAAVISANMAGPTGVRGRELTESLMGACLRYYKSRGTHQA